MTPAGEKTPQVSRRQRQVERGAADPRRVPQTQVRLAGDGGAALVEFALLAPLLFALLIGMFTGGISLSRKNSMTNAVREGSRLGATLVEGGSWATSVRDRVDALAGADLSSSQICVELAVKTSAGETTVRSTPGTCPFSGEPAMPAGVQQGECVAKVWARRTSDLEVVFFSRTLTLEADAVARFERGGAGACT
jgi:hypothetical protein